MKNNLSSVVGLLTVMILKRVCVREFFFFKVKNLKHVKLKIETEGPKSLTTFNLWKIIHLF